MTVAKPAPGCPAVVTGAGSGIGRALALALAERGSRVVVSDLSGAAAQETASLIRQRGGSASAHELDVTDRAGVFAHAEQLGPVGLVVNNAGVALHGEVERLSEADLRWVMDVDFWGVVHGTQAFLPGLRAAGTSAEPSRLVNISSLFGLVAWPGQSAYNAAKFAVRGFTESLAQELRMERAPVTAHCVHPGGVRTQIVRSARVAVGVDHEQVAISFEQVARLTPEQCAARILRGVDRGHPRIVVGADAHLIGALPRVLGAQYGRVIAYAVERRLSRAPRGTAGGGRQAGGSR